MKRLRPSRNGQGLVEFALVLPVFLLILFGLIDGARFVYMNTVVSQAAREGARLAATEARWIGNPTADPSCVANAGLITSANPGAHVCPATETGATNSLAGGHHGCFQSDGGSVRGRQQRLFQLSAEHDRSDRRLDGPSVSHHANRLAAKNNVWVRVDMPFRPITPILGQLWAPTISGSATMTVN